MHQFIEEFKDFTKKGDWVLLILCLVTAGAGCIIIASATNAEKFGDDHIKYIIIQLAAVMIGVFAYAFVSSIDVDFISEHRTALVAFNIILLLLLIPFGTDNNTGNRSWLNFKILPVMIQPAEICKITYILIMASVMASHQNDISSVPAVMHMVLHLGILVGLNMVLSGDAGVSLIFVFIFIGMAFAGGVSLWWFLLAFGVIAVAVPFAYATNSRAKGALAALVSGLAEPAGALVALFLFRSLFTPGFLTGTMVLVAGIMIWVALAQLLPTAFAPAHRLPGILGAAAGCLLMLLGIAALP